MIVLMLSGVRLSSKGLDLFAILQLDWKEKKNNINQNKKKTLCSFAERLCLIQTNGGRAQRYQAVLWTWNASRRAICPERLHADRIRERTDAQWRRGETREVK